MFLLSNLPAVTTERDQRHGVSHFAHLACLGTKAGFNISRKLYDGSLIHVAWRANIEEAEELVRSLRAFWTGEYLIQGAQRRDNGYPAFAHSSGADK